MTKEPVIVRGPMGFGLKTIARSLKNHGLIQTGWPDGVTDGSRVTEGTTLVVIE